APAGDPSTRRTRGSPHGARRSSASRDCRCGPPSVTNAERHRLAGRRALLLGCDLLADLLERAPDQPGDVHLRDPDLLRDLRLGQAFEEPQVENLPLAVVENAEARREHRPVLGDLVLVLLRADRLERVELAVL